MIWKNKGHEYDYLEDFFKESHRYVIWGAGTFGKTFYDRMNAYLDVICFVDKKYISMRGGYKGISVKSPEEFLRNRTNEIIIVSTGWTEAVYSILDKKGYKRFSDYFHIDDFEALFMYFAKHKVCLSDVTLNITQYCSLKCEHCSAFIPYIKNPVHFSLDYIKSQLDMLMNWVDEINVLGLCGGDAMVHPEFNDILEYIGENFYPNRVRSIEIYSNAILIPDDKSIELFKKYNVYYRFTDYSQNTNKQRIPKVKDILISNGIEFDHAKFDTWFDCGYPQNSNGITSENGLVSFCSACDRKTCHSMYGSKFYSCGMCINASLIGYCQSVEEDCFDLTHFDDKRKMEFLEYYLGYSEKGYYEYCKKCNGGQNVNNKTVPAGRQVDGK